MRKKKFAVFTNCNSNAFEFALTLYGMRIEWGSIRQPGWQCNECKYIISAAAQINC